MCRDCAVGYLESIDTASFESQSAGGSLDDSLPDREPNDFQWYGEYGEVHSAKAYRWRLFIAAGIVLTVAALALLALAV